MMANQVEYLIGETIPSIETKLNQILAISNAGVLTIEREHIIVWESPGKTRIFDDSSLELNIEEFFSSMGFNFLYYIARKPVID